MCDLTVIESMEYGREQIDLVTGEIIDPVYEVIYYKHSKGSKTVNKCLNRSHYEARDLQELKEICRLNASEWAHRRLIRSPKIFDLVCNGSIKGNDLEVFLKLADHIYRRNVMVTHTDELAELIGVDKKHLSREVSKIEQAGLIHIFKPKGQRDSYRLVAFNPALVWKGCYIIKTILETRILKSGDPWWSVDLLGCIEEI